MDDELMRPEDVVAATRGTVSLGSLAQRRYKGLAPAYLKPTPRTVLYRRSVVEAWLEESERTSTAEASA
ncbi:hypothetical protein DEJ28_14220 [Curtobacterium sp. MCPF17_002]|uniref:helix-turn-helix transcriptional regulator n=1 Tax=Curtobacterium sp. MCPF17_002 TaxID=2175645 RepID=UPI0021ABA793|nr:hypothetical protein [Curtobacterium sp. MCPF17_002]WIB76798.1 hypothetical protein DEJ28_14220 [Curtobacterium sp. MCPF17_002]